ncbi:MAG: YbbR-like domain-containing protein [Bacteroidaceae bacterium]|nr:YbbR-like domain-containing protein [Bacteroidaceae bacterium]
MDRVQWQRVGEAMKQMMLSNRTRELMIFTFFLLVSTGFWYIQTLDETYEVEVKFPLKLMNVPKGVIITSDLPPSLRVVLRDKGSTLVRYYRFNAPPTLFVDFSQRHNDALTGSDEITMSEAQKMVARHLQPSTSIVSIHADSLDYFYNRGVKRRLPVRFSGNVKTSRQYYLTDFLCHPDCVTVWAPQQVLDTMTAAYTEPLDITGLTHQEKHTLSLAPIRGAKFEPSEVQFIANVDLYTEKTLEVPIIGINFPADRDLRTFPARVSLTFKVGTRMYKQINEKDFVLAVTYEELLSNSGNGHFRPHLRSIPDGVSQIRFTPEEVEYLIEQVEEAD